ncbi:DUF2716 domain-containing protein [Streptomyces goshikiensis]|uniref:DUF2716 domain-containing protein n=1 Tax=Streptomyces goshikiensis TaxID=1942 RepID=UPI00367FAE99
MDALLAAYDEQVRGHVPERAPVGSVVERDGLVVRTHYGTHGTVRHSPLGKETDRAEVTKLIRRQQEAFAARCEPAEWRAYGHDLIPMDEPLRAAGFAAAGPSQKLLIAELDDLTGMARARGQRLRRLGCGYHRVRELDRLVAACEPYPRSLADIREDHGNLLSWALNVQLLEAETRLVGAGWAEAVGATEFVAVRGMTGPRTEFLPHWVRWARTSRALHMGAGKAPERRYLTAEAPEGPILDALLAAGFRAVSSVRNYLWTPAGPPPATQRPVSMLLDDPDHNALCEAFEADFSFEPSHTYYPSIEEPPDSVTWHVGDVTDTRHTYGVMRDLPDDHRVARLQNIVERGLRACVRPGEQLYSVSWWHPGHRFDPKRVGGSGQPTWPGAACWEGEYHKLLTRDLRMGTFWHPWEESLCVFGTELLAEVGDELTAALGTVMRRGGRNTGNIWTYESQNSPHRAAQPHHPPTGTPPSGTGSTVRSDSASDSHGFPTVWSTRGPTNKAPSPPAEAHAT